MTITIAPQFDEVKVSATLAINEKSKELEAKGKQIFRYGFGQSPFPVPDILIEELCEKAPEKLYLPSHGLLELRENIIKFQRHFYKTDEKHYSSADNIFIGPGSKELLFDLLLLINGTLLLPKGSWVSYEPQARILKKPVIYIDTKYADSYKITRESLTETLKTVDEAQHLILIMSPLTNPVGSNYTMEEIRVLGEICKERNITVISDEIYTLLNHKSEEWEPSPSMSMVLPEQTIITNGLSKAFGAGGWRIGYCVIPNNLLLVLEKPLISLISETYSCVAAPIQYAAIKAYDVETFQMSILSIMKKQIKVLNHIYSRIDNELKQTKLIYHDYGAYYLMPIFVNYREIFKTKLNINNSNELATYLLDELGIATLSGDEFGINSEDLALRFAFVNFDGKKSLENMDYLDDVIEDTVKGFKTLRECNVLKEMTEKDQLSSSDRNLMDKCDPATFNKMWKVLDNLAKDKPLVYRKFLQQQFEKAEEEKKIAHPFILLKGCTRLNLNVYLTITYSPRITKTKNEQGQLQYFGSFKLLSCTVCKNKNCYFAIVTFSKQFLESIPLNDLCSDMTILMNEINSSIKLTGMLVVKVPSKDDSFHGTLTFDDLIHQYLISSNRSKIIEVVPTEPTSAINMRFVKKSYINLTIPQIIFQELDDGKSFNLGVEVTITNIDKVKARNIKITYEEEKNQLNICETNRVMKLIQLPKELYRDNELPIRIKWIKKDSFLLILIPLIQQL
ncbi:hypothetical protein SNEBB_003204 [Seison nebaliae]|nr:hypothetical protein SNEBB_003204 [Seison nebaliae]